VIYNVRVSLNLLAARGKKTFHFSDDVLFSFERIMLLDMMCVCVSIRWVYESLISIMSYYREAGKALKGLIKKRPLTT
jgi:hypothetical protein